MGYSGDEIYQKVVAQKLGTEGMFQSKDQVFGLTQRFNEISDRIKQAAGKLEGSWKGNASGAAKRGAGPAGVVYSTMGESLDKAQDLTRAQAQTFDEVNPRIKPIPSVPAEPNGLTKFGSIIPGISDWTGAGEDVSNYDAAVASKQAAEANNVHHYQNLATATGYNVGNLPKEYGPQQAEGGQFSVDSGGSGGAPLRSGGGHPMSVNPPATGGGGGTGGHASAGGGSSAPNQAPPTVGGSGGGGGQAVAHGPAGGAGNVPPPQVGTGSGGTGAQAGTNTAGYAPPPVDPSLPGGGTGTATPYGGSGGATGTGSPYSGLGGGGFVGGYNNSGGGSSRFGSGGPRGTAGFGEGTGGRGGSGVGGGKGAGSEGGLKGGPRSGAGRMPAEEPSAGSGRGAAGAASRSGASGMPMTGSGARKQDDKERSGAGYLITRENGQEIVGDLPPTAPPVIGEDVEPKRPKD